MSSTPKRSAGSSSRSAGSPSGTTSSTTTSTISPALDLTSPVLVSAPSANSNSSLATSSLGTAKVGRPYGPTSGQSTHDISNLSLTSSSTVRSPSPTAAPPAKKSRAMVVPLNWDSDRYRTPAPVVPSGSRADAAVLPQYPQFVLVNLAEGISGDIVEAYLQSNSFPYRVVNVKSPPGKAIITFNALSEHFVVRTHKFPWGVPFQRSIDLPYADFDVSLRLQFGIPDNHMGNPVLCIAGGLASLGAIVEGGKWSDSVPDHFNIYVESLDCATAVMRHRGSFIIASDEGESDTTLLLKRDKCSLIANGLAKVFVGNIRKDVTEIEVEDTIIGVLEAALFSPAKFIYFSAHRDARAKDNKQKDSRPSSFGFAHVMGADIANFLCLPATQPAFNGRFAINAMRPKRVNPN